MANATLKRPEPPKLIFPVRATGPTKRVLWRYEADEPGKPGTGAGWLYLPKEFGQRVCYPDGHVAPRVRLGEIGICRMRHIRPTIDPATGLVVGWQLIADDITHNERVDRGASIQANRVFGGGAHTAAGVFTAVAVASAALTKTNTDLSLGSATISVTTNEFTTIGLSRAAGTAGTYTVPASLGATFTQRVSKTFTASGSGTAKGSGIFDSTTVSGSFLYVEDNHTDAVLVNLDQLIENWDITN
jgi:hypothetical protein